jgi:hypothetical protein
VTLRTPNNGLNASDELAFVEGFGQIVIGADAETLDLVLHVRQARKNQNGRIDLGCPQPVKNLVTVYIRQHKIQKNNIVIVYFSDFQAVFAQVRRVHDESLCTKHRYDAVCD